MKIKYLKPRSFFLGIVLGFIACCITGHIISKSARFYHFTRFYNAIQPSGALYYPTPDELLVTARHKVSHDKILVLIGGNSILKGVGQNPNEIWSDELQRLLGDQYKVLNFAIDGASVNSFAGVMFRILKNEYPKIIFVCNSSQFVPDPIEGIWVYTYLFWDAYYKNLIPLTKEEKERVMVLRSNHIRITKDLEEQLASFLDSYFYFDNLWNWVGYRYVFTVWADHIGHRFRARRRYYDKASSATKEKFEKIEKERFQETLNNLSAMVTNHFENENGIARIHEHLYQDAYGLLKNSFPLQERTKILSVIVTHNPKYILSLPKEQQQLYFKIFEQVRLMLESLDYPTLSMGKDFEPRDYADSCHLSGSGGKKIAIQVAKKVKQLAMLNGYVGWA